MLKAVIFDFDGTLVDTNKVHALNFQECFKLIFGLRIPAREIYPLFGKNIKEVAKEFCRKHNIKASAGELEEFASLKTVLFLGSVKERKLFGKKQRLFLKELRKKGLKLAIASGSTNEMLKACIPEKDLKLFNAVMTSDSVKKAKPHAEMLLKALEKLKVKRKEAVFVGDGILDAVLARNSGVKFVALLSGITSRREFGKFKPLAILKSLEELENALREF